MSKLQLIAAVKLSVLCILDRVNDRECIHFIYRDNKARCPNLFFPWGEVRKTGVGSIQVAMKGRRFGYSSRVPRSMGMHYFCL